MKAYFTNHFPIFYVSSSSEPEATVYPDYVQDNLEMALWKVQRCMSWSSCSYRTVVMIGRGRPNRTSFYLQREHWRGWIRSALEIGAKAEIPVIDWELEAKFLAQMVPCWMLMIETIMKYSHSSFISLTVIFFCHLGKPSTHNPLFCFSLRKPYRQQSSYLSDLILVVTSLIDLLVLYS